ncbi:hypothetical protein TNIN_164561 [Trichonephila inaurata madagascariensis]|uniref:C2H2-type domain-containing protein n=1 Tax=Trichonephila inaurata madagascariensis TaxID=2747483 RepID=A0A8X7BQP6_9ARAC|nr:hypothetical protein TNIN_164561 [Trichonephila inaurata madagascariensis]
MEESNVSSSEELFYFCFYCAHVRKELVYTVVSFEDSSFMCTLCRKWFRSGYQTKKLTSPHRCDDCGEWFASSLEVKYHSEDHFGVGSYRCSTCQRTFANYSLLEWHTKQRDVIQEMRCFKCVKHFLAKVCPGMYRYLVSRFLVYCKECSSGLNYMEYMTL